MPVPLVVPPIFFYVLIVSPTIRATAAACIIVVVAIQVVTIAPLAFGVGGDGDGSLAIAWIQVMTLLLTKFLFDAIVVICNGNSHKSLIVTLTCRRRYCPQQQRQRRQEGQQWYGHGKKVVGRLAKIRRWDDGSVLVVIPPIIIVTR
jgi:hypothetical protein